MSHLEDWVIWVLIGTPYVVAILEGLWIWTVGHRLKKLVRDWEKNKVWVLK